MSRSRRRPRPRFVVCVDNSAYRASLELHKIYRMLADGAAAALVIEVDKARYTKRPRRR